MKTKIERIGSGRRPASLCFWLALALCGCGGSSDGDADSGMRVDSGFARDATADGPSAPDSGPADAAPPDAPIAVDGGPLSCGSDPGPAPGDCVLRVPVGSFGPLVDACLPRCTAATGAAWRACTTQSCKRAALDADTTPGVQYYIGTARITSPMNCDACVSYQEFHCFSLVCGAEVDSYVDECIAGGTPSSCDTALFQLDNCLAGLTPTEEATVAACYESHDGPASCFACD